MKTPEAKAAEEADRVQLVEALAEHPGTPWGEAIGKVAALRIEHDTLLRGVAHPMWLPSVADAIGMDEPFQATSTDVLAMVRARMEERDKAQADLADGRIGNAAWGAFIDELRASLACARQDIDRARSAARIVGFLDAAALIDDESTFDLTTALSEYINLDAMSVDGRARAIGVAEAAVAFAVRAIRAHTDHLSKSESAWSES